MINIKKEKIIIKLTILSFILYMIIILIFEYLIYTIMGIGFLSFLGFTYTSYKNVLIFLTICYIILQPANYYTSVLIGIFNNKSNITKFQQRMIDFILYLTLSSLIIGSADFFIDGINISPDNQVLFILLSYLFETYYNAVLLSKK